MRRKKIAYREQEQLERDWILFNKRTTLSGTKKTDVWYYESYWGRIDTKANYKEWKKCCKLAYKIAMLPERSIEDYV